MTSTEIATRVDLLPPHELANAVELERQDRAARRNRPRKSPRRDWPMTATSNPIGIPVGFSPIYV